MTPPGSSRRPFASKRIYLWAAALHFAGYLLGHALGIRFADNTLGFLYQYLDPEILRSDLLDGLYYLHAQPPLFNLFLGVVLKSFPGSSSVAFALSYGVMSLGLLMALVFVMRRLGVSDGINLLLCALVVVSPTFLVYSQWLFYTLPVAFLVMGMTALLVGYLDSGRPWLAHLFSWCAAALMLTRALFHPLWLVAAILAVSLAAGRSKAKPLLVSALAPFLVVNLWFLKNYVLVESYGASSWVGMSLAKRWPLSQAEMARLRREGKLPPVWHRRPFREPDELAPLGYFKGNELVHPALDHAYKSNGEPNFNHRDYARISRKMLEADLYLILHYPGRYAQRVATAFLLYLQPGPNAVDFLVDYDFSRVDRYREWLTQTVFLGGNIERPIRMLEPPVNLWLIGFPGLLAFGAVRMFRRDRFASSDRKPVFIFIVVTVGWVTLVSNAIEIGENDRMRWEIEPLLVVLLGTALQSLKGALPDRWNRRGETARERSVQPLRGG